MLTTARVPGRFMAACGQEGGKVLLYLCCSKSFPSGSPSRSLVGRWENLKSLGQVSAGLTESQAFLQKLISPGTQAALAVTASGADWREGRERMAFPGEQATIQSCLGLRTGVDLGLQKEHRHRVAAQRMWWQDQIDADLSWGTLRIRTPTPSLASGWLGLVTTEFPWQSDSWSSQDQRKVARGWQTWSCPGLWCMGTPFCSACGKKGEIGQRVTDSPQKPGLGGGCEDNLSFLPFL